MTGLVSPVKAFCLKCLGALMVCCVIIIVMSLFVMIYKGLASTDVSFPGLIEIDDKVEDNPDDEILAELRRKQQELKALSQRNVTITKTLYKLAKEEMARQEMRKKLSAADAEVSTSLPSLVP